MVTLDLWVTDPLHYRLHQRGYCRRISPSGVGPLTYNLKLSLLCYQIFTFSDFSDWKSQLDPCEDVFRLCVISGRWRHQVGMCVSECVCVCVWRCLGSSLHLLSLFSAHWGLDSQNAFQAAVDSQHCALAPQTALGISCFRQRLLVCACIREGLTQCVCWWESLKTLF